MGVPDHDGSGLPVGEADALIVQALKALREGEVLRLTGRRIDETELLKEPMHGIRTPKGI